MRSLRNAFLPMMAAMMVSCLNTTETELYDDAAMTDFSLTTAVMYVVTQDSLGEDSVYTTTTTTVANYEFVIDQYEGLIYNPDSLEKEICDEKMLCTFSTKNSGVAIIISTEREDSASYLSTTDTIDFSVPRTVQVYSTSANYVRTYTINVNRHREIADSFTWNRKSDFEKLTDFIGMKTVAHNGNIVLFGSDGKSTLMYSTDQYDGNSWSLTGEAFGADAYKNVVLAEGMIYVLDGSSLMVSEDGDSFETITDEAPIDRLVSACSTELYGMTDEGIWSSTDGGLTWQLDGLDDDLELLPQVSISGCYSDFEHNPNSEQAFIAGYLSESENSSDSTAYVWRKIVEHDEGSKTHEWSLIIMDMTNDAPLWLLEGLQIMNCRDEMVAVGGQGLGGCEKEPFTELYFSADDGLTWDTDEYIIYPEDLECDDVFAAAVDDEYCVWILCGSSGQVWRGRLNRMGWTAE